MSNETPPKEWKMLYTSLGGTGLQVSRLGFGLMMSTTVEHTKELVKTCRKYGINFFDNAEGYGNPRGGAETLFGQALKELQKEDSYLYRRTDLVITTKLFLGPSGHPKDSVTDFTGQYTGINERGICRKRIMEGTNNSLKRLQLDYVDVIYAHRFDVLTPVLEVVRAFTDIIKSGKAFYWGTSMWPNYRIIEAFYLAKLHNLIPPIVEQPKYSMFDREFMEDHYLPVFKSPYNIGTTIWNVLDTGILSGKYNRKDVPEDARRSKTSPFAAFYGDIQQQKLKKVDKLQTIAEKLNTTVANLAVAWCLMNKNVSVIMLGASNSKQLDETCASVKLVDKLTDSVMKEIEDVLQNKPILNPDFANTWQRIPNAKL